MITDTEQLMKLLADPLPPANFRYILLARVNPEENEKRYYYLGLQPTLFYPLAVVRYYGRIGQTQRVIQPVPVNSLTDAWPLLRQIIRTRLRYGYRTLEFR
jgi:predicted DNA-binding WGR domain protein